VQSNQKSTPLCNGRLPAPTPDRVPYDIISGNIDLQMQTRYSASHASINGVE
jgi:hypothetical protein